MANFIQEMAEKVPGWLERILLPQLSELKGDVKVAQAKIEGVEEKLEGKVDGLDQKLTGRVDSLDQKLTAKIEGLDQKLTSRIDGLEGRMESEFKTVHTEIGRLDDKIDALDKRTDVTQRLAVVEEQLKELRAKA